MKKYEAPLAMTMSFESADIITLSPAQTATLEGDHYESAYEIWYDKLG